MGCHGQGKRHRSVGFGRYLLSVYHELDPERGTDKEETFSKKLRIQSGERSINIPLQHTAVSAKNGLGGGKYCKNMEENWLRLILKEKLGLGKYQCKAGGSA